MDNNKIILTINFSNLLQQISALFNLSLPEIKKRYADYPHCLMNYFEADIEEKLIEIRFDQEEFTITCKVNDDDKCQFIYLVPDKTEFIEELMLFFKDSYEYDYLRNRWVALGFYIVVKAIGQSPNEVCWMFYY